MGLLRSDDLETTLKGMSFFSITFFIASKERQTKIPVVCFYLHCYVIFLHGNSWSHVGLGVRWSVCTLDAPVVAQWEPQIFWFARCYTHYWGGFQLSHQTFRHCRQWTHLQVVPATGLSRPSSRSHRCSEASSYWSVNLEGEKRILFTWL